MQLASRQHGAFPALRTFAGHEQAGHRPVLIVSDDRYTIARKLAVEFPLTTNDRLKRALAIELPSLTGRRSFALPGQVRSLSVIRLGRLSRR